MMEPDMQGVVLTLWSLADLAGGRIVLEPVASKQKLPVNAD